MKVLVKLIIVVLLANGLWRVGSAYMTFYRFKDSVTAAASETNGTEEELRQKVAELATTYDLPLTADDITVTRAPNHTSVQGSFKKAVMLVPGFDYEWPFSVEIDAYPIVPPTRRGDLIKP